MLNQLLISLSRLMCLKVSHRYNRIAGHIPRQGIKVILYRDRIHISLDV